MKKILNWITKNRKNTILFVLCLFILPVLVMISGYAFVNFLANYFQNSNPLVNIDPNITTSTTEIISIYFSILGIIIGAILTIAVFMLQENSEKEKLYSIQKYYYSEIIKSLESLLLNDGSKISLEHSSWIEMSIKIQENIGAKDFEVINNLCISLIDAKKDKDSNLKNFVLAPCFQYYKPELKRISKVTDILNKEIIEALNSLNPNKEKELEFYGTKYYKDGEVFSEIYQLDKETYFKVYDTKDNLLCDCTFSSNRPFNGYGLIYAKRMFHPIDYLGQIKNGIPNGKGYKSWDEFKLEEGVYQNDTLVEGKVFSIRTTQDGDVFGDKIQQLYIDFIPSDGENEADKDFLIPCYYADFKIKNEMRTIDSEITKILIVDGVKKQQQMMEKMKAGLQNSIHNIMRSLP